MLYAALCEHLQIFGVVGGVCTHRNFAGKGPFDENLFRY